MSLIDVIDSHTGGEPTRLVLSGFPDLGTGTLAERRDRMRLQHDAWRRATMLEPRGNEVIVGALLCPPDDPTAAAGVIFFNNNGYLGMCGHGTIGLVRSLQHLGRLAVGTHRIDTPVGPVDTTLHDDGSVSVRNVPSRRSLAGVVVDVPGIGPVRGDVAWGGNWFFLVDDPDQRLALDAVTQLTDRARRIRLALAAAGITGDDGAPIDHIELFGPDPEADSRSFVLCPGDAYDRSPCGTGTSAKLACLAADGKLAPDTVWTQASVIGSRFEARYAWVDGQVVPTIRGRAHITARAVLTIEEDDPFAWGITVGR